MSRDASALMAELDRFRNEHGVRSKGNLALVLYVTRYARDHGLPINSQHLITPHRGQVRGLSRSAVQGILKDHGISRVLAAEAGRTSRGSLGLMEAYVQLLNKAPADGGALLGHIEEYWVQQVRRFFSSKPFAVRLDPQKSLRAVVRDVLEQAAQRQRESGGTMYQGAVLQHLVAAKLKILSPDHFSPRGAFVSDDPGAVGGDFEVGDVVFHVTTAPGEAVIAKCRTNIEGGRRPVLVTMPAGVQVATGLAANAGIEDRIDILDAEQFIATNVYEWSDFRFRQCRVTVIQLIDTYNAIVQECETDPSLLLKLI